MGRLLAVSDRLHALRAALISSLPRALSVSSSSRRNSRRHPEPVTDNRGVATLSRVWASDFVSSALHWGLVERVAVVGVGAGVGAVAAGGWCWAGSL